MGFKGVAIPSGMPASHSACNDGVLSSHTHSPALDHPPSLRVKLEPGPETSDAILDDGLGAQVTGHLLFHSDFRENESAPAEEDPAPSGHDLVVREGEPQEEPAAAAAGAPLKWPEMRPDEIVVEEMKKFATANGAEMRGGLRVQQVRRVSECATAGVIDVYYLVKDEKTGVETKWRSKKGLVRNLLGLGPKDPIPDDLRSPAKQARQTPKKAAPRPKTTSTPRRTPGRQEKRQREEPADPSGMVLDHPPVAVVCGDKAGILNLQTNQVCCSCAECQDAPSQSARQFEKHAGRAASNSWRHSVRVMEGLPEGDRGIPVFKWAAQKNVFLVGTKSPVKRLHLSDALENEDAQAASREALPAWERAKAPRSDAEEEEAAPADDEQQSHEKPLPGVPQSPGGACTDMGMSPSRSAQQRSLSSAGSSELRAGSCEDYGPEGEQQQGHPHGNEQQPGIDLGDQEVRKHGHAGGDLQQPGRDPRLRHQHGNGECTNSGNDEEGYRGGDGHEGQDVSSRPQNPLTSQHGLGRPSGLPRQPLQARTSTSGMGLAFAKQQGGEAQPSGAVASPVASGSHFSGHSSGHHTPGEQQASLDAQRNTESDQAQPQHADERLENALAANQLMAKQLAESEKRAEVVHEVHENIRELYVREAASLKRQLLAAEDASKLRDQELQELRNSAAAANQAAASAPAQEPSKELLEDMQRQQTEIEMLSTELDESQRQLRAARASETHLQGTLRAKTALLSFHDDVIAQKDKHIESLEQQMRQLKRNAKQNVRPAGAAASCFSGQ